MIVSAEQNGEYSKHCQGKVNLTWLRVLGLIACLQEQSFNVSLKKGFSFSPITNSWRETNKILSSDRSHQRPSPSCFIPTLHPNPCHIILVLMIAPILFVGIVSMYPSLNKEMRRKVSVRAEDNSVDKVLDVQAWGLEFRSPEPM